MIGSNAYADTLIPPGDVNGTWTLADSPYIVQGKIEIAETETLIIDPGVLVKFESGASLKLHGTLTAIGTEAQNITFTSAQLSPSPADWNGVGFYSGSQNSELEWCVFEYATNGVSCQSNIIINESVFRYNESAGILVRGSAYGCSSTNGLPTISRCISELNSGYGVHYLGEGSGGCQPTRRSGTAGGTLRNCSIRGNGLSGIHIHTDGGIGNSGRATPNIIENQIYSNSEHGIVISGDDTASPNINRNQIYDNADTGIHIENSVGTKIIIGNSIYENGREGISNIDEDTVIDDNQITQNLSYGVETSSLGSFAGNTINSNTTYDFFYTGTTDQCAANNDWGSTNPSTIDSLIYDKQDDPALGLVIWDNSSIASQVYYVNDSSTVKDEWCSAPGDEVNDGLSPATPKATVQSILSTYDLEPGDIVRIDTGVYTLTSNIEVTSDDEGSCLSPVTFEASPYGVTFDRNSAANGSYGWYLHSCDYVDIKTVSSTKYPGETQSWMKITGGYRGMYVSFANRCNISRLEVYSNARQGIYSYYSNYISLKNNIIHGNSSIGISLFFSGYNTLENNTIVLNGVDQIYFSDSPGLTAKNNIFHADTSGRYAVRGYSVIGNTDYNLFYATNGALIGDFNGIVCNSIAEWQAASNNDLNSFSDDPGLVNPAGGQFHLKSTAGSYHGGAWTLDASDSQCIDAGDPVDTYENEPEENGNRINIGAYGGTEYASISPLDTDGDGILNSLDNCPYIHNPEQADFDQDDIGDACEIIGDVTGDGEIDLRDVISCLKIITGNPVPEISNYGENRIGFDDAFFIFSHMLNEDEGN